MVRDELLTVYNEIKSLIESGDADALTDWITTAESIEFTGVITPGYGADFTNITVKFPRYEINTVMMELRSGPESVNCYDIADEIAQAVRDLYEF